MILIQTTIERRGADMSASEWKGFLRTAWKASGEEWHAGMRPKHFTFAAIAEYGYQARKASYELRKAKKLGHRRPLVWSGETERMTGRSRDVRYTDKGVTVVLQAPKHLYQRRGSAPDKAEELQRVSEREVAQLATLIETRITEEANTAGGSGRIA